MTLKKSVLFAAMLMGVSVAAQAQTYSAVVADSACEVVAKSGSTTGALTGSAVGGVAGAVIGDALFGRSGRALGGLFGGAAGGAMGENLAGSKTYKCVITAEVPTVGKVYVESLGRPRNIGEQIVLVKTHTGAWLVRP